MQFVFNTYFTVICPSNKTNWHEIAACVWVRERGEQKASAQMTTGSDFLNWRFINILNSGCLLMDQEEKGGQRRARRTEKWEDAWQRFLGEIREGLESAAAEEQLW